MLPIDCRLLSRISSSSGTPLAGLVELLAGFGAVDGDHGRPVVTPLGRWAVAHLADGMPGSPDPGLPAGEMIAAVAGFGDEEGVNRRLAALGREPS